MHIFLPFIIWASPLPEYSMRPGFMNKLNYPLGKQAPAFIFLWGFGFARIKVTLARFIWISMKTFNPLLCNILYFNIFNNYCFPFLIKSLEMETLERDQNGRLLLWRMGRNVCIADQYSEQATEHLDFNSVFIVPVLWKRPQMLKITDMVGNFCILPGVHMEWPRSHANNNINSEQYPPGNVASSS